LEGRLSWLSATSLITWAREKKKEKKKKKKKNKKKKYSCERALGRIHRSGVRSEKLLGGDCIRIARKAPCSGEMLCFLTVPAERARIFPRTPIT